MADIEPEPFLFAALFHQPALTLVLLTFGSVLVPVRMVKTFKSCAPSNDFARSAFFGSGHVFVQFSHQSVAILVLRYV